MFDKTLFDRNAFDRSVSSDGIAIIALGDGRIGLGLVVKMPNGCLLNGVGALTSNVKMQQSFAQIFTGTGKINNMVIVLRRSTSAFLSGQGGLTSNFTIRMPIAAALSGRGATTINSQMFLQQYMRGSLSGNSVLTPKPILATMMTCKMYGSGEMPLQIRLLLIITTLCEGQGTLTLRRLGAFNENVIELLGINLLPGETVTIDTDLLQVLFGSVEDVSSITTDSVFFELNPGENEIDIDVDSDTTMDVVALWQNRWL